MDKWDEYRTYGAFLKHVHQGNPVKAIAKWDYLLKRDGQQTAVARLNYVLDQGPALHLSDYKLIVNITGVEV